MSNNYDNIINSIRTSGLKMIEDDVKLSPHDLQLYISKAQGELSSVLIEISNLRALLEDYEDEDGDAKKAELKKIKEELSKRNEEYVLSCLEIAGLLACTIDHHSEIFDFYIESK